MSEFDWQQVSSLVASRYKEAADLRQKLKQVVRKLPKLSSGYGHVFWHPQDKTIWLVAGDSDEYKDIQPLENRLRAIPGVADVRVESEYGPYGDDAWVRIKSASFGLMNLPYRMAGTLTGGPSAFSNALVSGLLGGGAGYATGAVLENLLPEEYVERGNLRQNLAMLGGLGGVAAHVPQALTNAEINRKATGHPHWFRSFFQGDAAQQMSPHELDWRNHYLGGQPKKANWQKVQALLAELPKPPARVAAACDSFAKYADSAGLYGSNNVPLKPVPVDAFNNAIWNDVHNGSRSSQSNFYGTRSPYSDNSDGFHTPPVNAAAATGLVTGIQQMYGGTPTLSPMHFVRGLANAGIDMATARVAGGVLGTLGGLTPKAQQQLQQMGLWSGLIRGVTSSVLGLP